MLRFACNVLKPVKLKVRYSPVSRVVRKLCSDPPTDLTEGEKSLANQLQKKFPGASLIQVQDISGGCGSMYDIQIIATEFEGKRTVLQHRMVNEALKEEIQDMHGLRIRTAAPTNT